MPKGVYIRTEEYKRNISETLKGRTLSLETRKKMSESGKEKIFSNTHRKNISIALKGRKKSNETKRLISNSLKGRKLSEKIKEKIRLNAKNNPNFGMKNKHLTEEQCRKMSLSRTGEKIFTGYKTTKMVLERKKLKPWKKAVLKKYDYKCGLTNINDGTLKVHHIENFADNEKLRIDVNNGIPLLEHLHIEFHKQYGFGNNTKEQFEEFKLHVKSVK